MTARMILMAILPAILMAPALYAQDDSLPEARPVSTAERAAVDIVARYLSAGPEEVWKSLATDAPLRSLGRADALLEIQARLGPSRDTRWKLETVVPALSVSTAAFSVAYESGNEDAIIFGMKKQKGWKIATIGTSAEAVEMNPLLPPSGKSVDERAWRRGHRFPLSVALAFSMIVLLGVVIADKQKRLGFGLAAIGGTAIVGAAVLVALPLAEAKMAAAAGSSENSVASSLPARLGKLVALRNAYASGSLAEDGMAAKLPPGPTRDVATLWEATHHLRNENLDEARHALRALPRSSSIPMAELLRARLAYLDKNDVQVVEAYERAVSLGPGRDGLWLEAAQTLVTLGFEERAEKYFERTATIGSREPVVYYALAARSAMSEDDARAEKLLKQAWNMRPWERARVLGNPVLWRVLRRPGVVKILQLHRVEEASLTIPVHDAMAMPAGATAESMGEHLRVRANGGELHVPGGANFSPVGTIVRDAAAWRRQEEDEALARFDEMRTRASSPAAFADRTFREQCVNTVVALAGRNRWQDITELGRDLSARDERVPVELTLVRGAALKRTGKGEELKKLIVDLLNNPSVKRTKDPEVLLEVAELVASMDFPDAAIRMMERAQGSIEIPGVAERIQQLEIEQKLASGYAIAKSDHFDIHYPPDTDERSIQRMGQILESERERLRSEWFPGVELGKVTVNILWWQDFATYTGSEYVAGLFTDEIFLPLAGLRDFPPKIVAIMTHELAHAFIAQATDDLAPRWFHEGLASAVQMNDHYQNAFQMYRDDRYLSVALLDAVANGSPDPSLIQESYKIGESTLRYMQNRYGRTVIAKLLAQFRDGSDTETAIRNVTGQSVADLDREARLWGAKAPATFAGNVVRYDEEAKRKGTVSYSGHRSEEYIIIIFR